MSDLHLKLIKSPNRIVRKRAISFDQKWKPIGSLFRENLINSFHPRFAAKIKKVRINFVTKMKNFIALYFDKIEVEYVMYFGNYVDFSKGHLW